MQNGCSGARPQCPLMGEGNVCLTICDGAQRSFVIMAVVGMAEVKRPRTESRAVPVFHPADGGAERSGAGEGAERAS